MPWWRVKSLPIRNTNPIARDLSASVQASRRQRFWSMAKRCRIPSAPCSTRSSRSNTGSRSHRARSPESPSGPWSHPRATNCWTWLTSIMIAAHSSGPRPWPGPRPRCNCATSTSWRRKRRTFSAWPRRFCMPTRVSGLPRWRSSAARVRSRGCGRTVFPAICRSSCCASTISRTSPRFVSCCGRTNTGG
ncbi:hypothetical protein D9M68_621340 [compost metagenome]